MNATVLDPRLRPADFQIQTWTLVIASIAVNILAFALPIVSQQIYDRVLKDHANGTLNVLIIGICVVVVVDAFLRLIRSYLIGLNGAAFIHMMSTSAVRNVLSNHWDAPHSSNVALSVEQLNAIRRLKEFHSGTMLCMCVDFLFIPVFLFLIYYIGGVVVLVPLIVIGLFALLCRFQGLWFAKLTQEATDADGERYSFLMRTLRGIHSVKALAMESNLSRRYEALQETSSSAHYGVSRIKLSAFGNFAVLSHLMTIAVVAASAYQVAVGHLTVGGVMAIVLLSGRLLQPVQTGLQFWLQYQDFAQSEVHARELFKIDDQVTIKNDQPVEDTGHLKIENLSFRYNQNSPLLLDNISIELKKGSVIAVHGEAGCGKSTLMKLIAGMHRPTAGNIFVNDRNVAHYSASQLMGHVGLISTRGDIFRGSIRDNITRFGKVPYPQVLEVANYLGVYEEIAKLPYGVDTFLSDSILDPVTPGLKQMISILRSLASKPHIILFDDADFALDQKNYERLYNLLGNIKQNVAMIIVSQDANLRSLADQHLELKDGRLSVSKRF